MGGLGGWDWIWGGSGGLEWLGVDLGGYGGVWWGFWGLLGGVGDLEGLGEDFGGLWGGYWGSGGVGMGFWWGYGGLGVILGQPWGGRERILGPIPTFGAFLGSQTPLCSCIISAPPPQIPPISDPNPPHFSPPSPPDASRLKSWIPAPIFGAFWGEILGSNPILGAFLAPKPQRRFGAPRLHLWAVSVRLHPNRRPLLPPNSPHGPHFSPPSPPAAS